MENHPQGVRRPSAKGRGRDGPGGRGPRGFVMPPKERPMTPADQAKSADKREIHRAQVHLVQASLRAGVQYRRPGRVAKAAPKRS